jgi:hypothetical protein
MSVAVGDGVWVPSGRGVFVASTVGLGRGMGVSVGIGVGDGDGVAVGLAVGAEKTGLTATCTSASTSPAALRAIRVYAIVLPGVIGCVS